MIRLRELIGKLRSGEIDFDEFLATAKAEYVWRRTPTYPETDGNVKERDGISGLTIAHAVYAKLLTREEATAVYKAVGFAPD